MILPLNAGVNLDKHPSYIDSEKGEVTGSMNLRPTSTSGGRMGIRTSLKSMLEHTVTLPAGTNKWIGFAEDKEREIGIGFNYNSNGNHGIYIYTGNSSYNLGIAGSELNFNVNEIIDADVLGDYCTFVSEHNPPRKIKIAVGSVPVFTNGLQDETAETIELARIHPVNAPECALGTDATRKVNKLVGKTFQFATYYVFQDYTYSVLSPYSKVLVSPAVFSASDNTFTDTTIGNFANITFDVGGDSVRKVVLVAREGNSGGWFKAFELDKNGEEGDYTVTFYNDKAREYLPIDKALALYSDVPLRARTVAAVANRIALGGVTKGYDKTKVPFTVEVEYETVDVDGAWTELPITTGDDLPLYNNAWVSIEMPASVTEGQTVAVSIQNGFYHGENQTVPVEIGFSYAASYVVKAGDDVDDVANFFYTDINTKGKSIVDYILPNDFFGYDIISEIVGGGVRITFVGIFEAGSYITVYGTASIATLAQGVNTYKAGSYYNAGVCLYDDKSRTSGVLMPTRVYIPTNGERAYSDVNKRARLKFTMGTYTPPSWATRLRFAVTESINFAGAYPFVTGNNAGGNAYENVYIDGKKVIAIRLPENFNYQFAKGDYVYLEKDSGSAITTIVKMVIGTRDLITVGTEDKVGFWLIIPQGSEAISDYQDVVGYIYRPKSEVEDLVYYEDFTTYNANISGQTGYIGEGDAWFVSRKFEYDDDASGYSEEHLVEDFFISIDDNLRAYSKGRAIVELPSTQLELQDVVWSEPYLDNTEINGMAFFSAESRKQLDEKDGKIAAIRLVGDVLKVVQKSKETSMYIGKQQITNADGTLSLVNTNNFIGTVYPMNTDYGTSSLRSVAVNGRDLFYWDGERRQVIRSSPNGQYPISDYGIKSRCLELGALIDTTLGRVISYYDRANDEFVIIFKAGNRVETWAFKEDMWWQYDFSDSNFNIAEACGHIGNTTLSLLKGKIYKHEAGTSYNTFFGAVKQLSVKVVVNIYPTQEKCLRSLILSSNKPLDGTITSPSSVTRQYGQKSYLKAETWFERDSKYVSAVFKNVIMNNGLENMNLIHKGNDMVGEYLEIELSETTNEEVRIQSLETNETVNM